ncbi:DUF4377 domain-containing protein [Polaribacter sp. AHE13PA]|uniref:DUF4377 domain-containing protein n=1 Tax=Polaribacter sp. AHE13PA TaxID=2745562 RepID=UPI001C4ED524|nr:DUF4377 domain-containing protein [Polaribacter sp. AHE13PA]QXP66164.1 DUF4377 domain-containing protein [Polaribacter sp. AHE13PA]
MKLKSIILVVFMLIISCEKNNLHINEKTIMIASAKVNCVGVAPQKCLLTKEEGAEDWGYFYSSITGFNYEEGFEYEVLISEKNIENPPQDASSKEYTLIKVISKVEKISKNLPE